MGKNNDKIIREAMHNGIKKQYQYGLAQGAYAMCQVILDMATDNSFSYKKRLNDIIRFCNVCANPDKKPNR